MNCFKIAWRLREDPRRPTAVAATGNVAKELARRILNASDASLSQWEGVSIADCIVVLGESELLPWVDGVTYLGADSNAPHLLLPTNRDPGLPLDLLEKVLLERCPYPPPLALLEADGRVLSLAQSRELSRDVLVAWLAAAA